ncbi:hypothetical protein G5V58_00550 [Nocardioides anomalus]|uniref:Uncharacterized protein n=1 Tax=Nocardioides anomalus TaxID=2712223 RepID=A0A6G6W8B7_9ACTN|nr:hypothetical protein [Nocardioides anomalus]QIG41462.1 hypothetical protein G5V58_00550 [Nocardioides anomalus]
MFNNHHRGPHAVTTLAGGELTFVLDSEDGPTVRGTVRARRDRLVLELDSSGADLLADRGLTLRVVQAGRELTRFGAATGPARWRRLRLLRAPVRRLPVVPATPSRPAPRHLALVGAPVR